MLVLGLLPSSSVEFPSCRVRLEAVAAELLEATRNSKTTDSRLLPSRAPVKNVDDNIGTPGTGTANAAPVYLPRTIWVGPDREHKTIGEAVKAAKRGETIETDAGLYPDDICVITADNVTIRGKGGYAHIKGTKQIPNGKALLLQRGNNLTLENLEFSGARVADKNGAAIRADGGKNLTVRRCYIHDNENGILTGIDPESDILIEHTEFFQNGEGSGLTHNIYIGRAKSFTLRYSYVHGAREGHNVKSRAETNHILYNRIMDEETGNASYQIDLPNGGYSYIIGNMIQQGPKTPNSSVISYGREVNGKTVLWNRGRELCMVNNTIVNDLPGRGYFVRSHQESSVVRLINNIFCGDGAVYDAARAKPLEMTANLVSVRDPGFKDRDRFDYSLTPTAKGAIDTGRGPGTANGNDLTPVYQYTHPVGKIPRPSHGPIDIGAIEFTPTP